MNQMSTPSTQDYGMYSPAGTTSSPHTMVSRQNPVMYMPSNAYPTCGYNHQMQTLPNINTTQNQPAMGNGMTTSAGNYIMTPTEQNMANNNGHNTPESLTNPYFWPAYLKNFVGYWARLDFLIGNQTQQVIGKLLDVGASYLVLEALEPDTLIMCDLFSLKFATIIYDTDIRRIANTMS